MLPKRKMENLRVLTAQEYIDRVNRTHVWESGLNALAENYRANQAAYSASHSHTRTNYAGGSVCMRRLEELSELVGLLLEERSGQQLTLGMPVPLILR